MFVGGLRRVQPADRVLVLLIRYLLPQPPGSAGVYDLGCSSIVAEETLARGGVPVMEQSGHAFFERRRLEAGGCAGERGQRAFLFFRPRR